MFLREYSFPARLASARFFDFGFLKLGLDDGDPFVDVGISAECLDDNPYAPLPYVPSLYARQGFLGRTASQRGREWA